MNFRILNDELIIICEIIGGANPTMTITSSTVSSGDKSNDSTIALIFTSSASTVNFIVGDITVSNGSLSNFSGSGTTYNATFTPSGDATYTISVAANTFTDTSSNNNNVSNTFTWTYDSTAPTAAITYDSIGPYKNGETVVITATFNEAMLDSPVPQIAIAGSGIASNSARFMTKISTTVYIYNYIVVIGDGTGTISLSNGTDLAGNVITSTPTSGTTFTVDNTSPTVSSFTLSNTALKAGDTPAVTLVFSEAVTGFNSDDDIFYI